MTIDAFISFLPASDLEATERFYRDHLGLRLVLDQGRCRIFEASVGGHIGFCLRDPLPVPERIILTLVVPDVDVWHERLRKCGLAPGPVEEVEEFRIRRFFIADPNGYKVEVQRFWDAGWRQGGTSGDRLA